MYALYHYYEQPNSIHTLMVVFWMQSVFIGFFNFLGMLSFTNRVPDSFTVNNQSGNRAGCAAGFFLVHYGGFHVAYLVFLSIQIVKGGHLDWPFIQLSFFAIAIGGTLQFIHDKLHNKMAPVNISSMFMMPYVCILPMHLAILLPAFFHISLGLVFLSLKMVADVVMHIIYRRLVFKDMQPN